MRGRSDSPTRAVVITAALASNIITVLSAGATDGFATSRTVLIDRLREELDDGPTFKVMEPADVIRLSGDVIAYIGDLYAESLRAALGEIDDRLGPGRL